MAATINTASITLEPKSDIRLLGVQLDTKLTWYAHVREIEKTMIMQTLALAKITTSTWGATFAKAWHLYIAVVRPAMTYASTVWHALKEPKGLSMPIENRLSVVQNKCVRLVSGGYKATLFRLVRPRRLSPLFRHISCS